MSQISRNQPGDNQGSAGRGMNESHERKHLEGFEGMNFEQIRQPYPNRKSNYQNEDHLDQQNGEEGN